MVNQLTGIKYEPRRPKLATEIIGKRIVSGQLKPGSLLPSNEDLAEEFSVSRLAIRESMKYLESKGLVEARQRRGTIVQPRSEWNRIDPDILAWQVNERPNAAFIRNLFETRRIIEPEAASLTAARAPQASLEAIEASFRQMSEAPAMSPDSIKGDIDFHRAILLGTGNDFLAAFEPVIVTGLRVAFALQRELVQNSDHFIPSHGAILEAIKRGDPEGAREAFHELLATSEDDAMNSLRGRQT